MTIKKAGPPKGTCFFVIFMEVVSVLIYILLLVLQRYSGWILPYPRQNSNSLWESVKVTKSYLERRNQKSTDAVF